MAKGGAGRGSPYLRQPPDLYISPGATSSGLIGGSTFRHNGYKMERLPVSRWPN